MVIFKQIKAGGDNMKQTERDIGKFVADKINMLPKLPAETQTYIVGFLNGVSAAIVTGSFPEKKK